MPSLYLIRHGQASFMSDNYDKLSPLGHQQAQLLGDYLGHRKFHFDAYYSGDLVRHVETFESSRPNYHIHVPMTGVLTQIPHLNEHQATEIFKANTSVLLEEDQELKKLIELKGVQDKEVKAGYLKLFFQGIKLWSKGELHADGYESYKEFSERCRIAYDLLAEAMQQNENIAAFTSGGTISALIGIMLKLSPEDVVDFNWQTRNTGITEFYFSKTRNKFFLRSFNETPHLSADMVTYV